MLRVVCCLLKVEAIWSLWFLCNHQLKKWQCYLSSSQLPRTLGLGFFKELHKPFFKHCNGVLHEANCLEGYGVVKTVQFLQLHNFLRTPYVIFYTYQWSTSWGKIIFFFEELYTPFSLYYDGVLHEAKFIIGHGVLKTWYHGRTSLFTFSCIAME